MQHASLAGASTWITAGVGGSHEFSEIFLKGNAHLAFDYGATESQASIVAGNIVGDKTGLHELLAYSALQFNLYWWFENFSDYIQILCIHVQMQIPP